MRCLPVGVGSAEAEWQICVTVIARIQRIVCLMKETDSASAKLSSTPSAAKGA
jgi:hypothetical protein